MILELEKQVASLELSKQLKDAGFPQETLWCWKEVIIDGKSYFEIVYKHFNGVIELISEKWKPYRSNFVWGNEIYAAPTVAELGELLPEMIETKSIIGGDGIKRFMVSVPPGYVQKFGTPPLCWGDTEADARAKMWLWLKKEGKV